MRSDIDDIENRIIVDWIEPGSKVLELGCGDGELLAQLIAEKRVRAQGIEIDDGSVYSCVKKGLNVLHEEIDEALSDYNDGIYDFTVFKRSMQRVVGRPDAVLKEALRISKKVIVSFSNFAHYQARWQILVKGRTPVTPSLPYEWHDTPNLHFLSIRDFEGWCRDKNVIIEKTAYIGRHGRVKVAPNLTALTGLFLITK